MNTGEKQLSNLIKALFWFVVANAEGGALLLILFPTQTETLFFWNITPPINAMLMGTMYLVAGTALAHAVLRGTWESTRFIAVMAFAFGIPLILVTLLHIDRFVPGIKLYYWLFIYLIAVVFWLIFWRYEQAGANWQVTSQAIKPLTRLSGIATGMGMLLLAVVGLFLPNLLINVWPWTVSELMLRVFMSWLVALAAGNLWFWVEKEWTRVQSVAYMLIAIPVLVAIIMLMNRADLTSNLLNLMIFSVLLVLMGLTGTFMLWGQRR